MTILCFTWEFYCNKKRKEGKLKVRFSQNILHNFLNASRILRSVFSRALNFPRSRRGETLVNFTSFNRGPPWPNLSEVKRRKNIRKYKYTVESSNFNSIAIQSPTLKDCPIPKKKEIPKWSHFCRSPSCWLLPASLFRLYPSQTPHPPPLPLFMSESRSAPSSTRTKWIWITKILWRECKFSFKINIL